jgi:predicted GNAT family acetyltransferase
LIFKADITSQTPRVSYLEGIWINPEVRLAGWGSCCITEVTRNLLGITPSVCVFVNEGNSAARRFYEGVGFRARALYDTVFLKSSADRVLQFPALDHSN